MNDDALISALDPAAFARPRRGCRPDPHQTLVLRSDARRGLLNCTRQWGKSTVTAAKAVHHAWTVPDSLVLVVCPTARQSGEFVRKAAGFLHKLGIRRKGDGLNEISLVLPNGSRLVGLPGKEDTIRGFSRPGLVLIDEAARVPDDLIQAVSPMLATCDGPMWLMSTPVGKRGFFWEAWSGAHGDEWTRISVKATECPRISRAHLARERKMMSERRFAQEYLCEFADAEGQMFRDDFIERALRSDIQPFGAPDPRRVSRVFTSVGIELSGNPAAPASAVEYVIGLDLGQAQDYTATAILERRETVFTRRDPVTWEPLRKVEYIVRHLARLPLDTPYTEVVEDIEKLVRRTALVGRSTLVVDATGVGRGVLDELKAARLACPIVAVTITGGEQAHEVNGMWRVPKRDLLGDLQLMLQRGDITISDRLEEAATLVKELRGMRVHVGAAGGEKIINWRDGAHDDLVFAVALATWFLRSKARRNRRPL